MAMVACLLVLLRSSIDIVLLVCDFVFVDYS